MNEINTEGLRKFDHDGSDHEEEGSSLDDEEGTLKCYLHANMVASATVIIREPKTFREAQWSADEELERCHEQGVSIID